MVDYIPLYSVLDFLMAPFYLALIYYLAGNIKRNNSSNPLYQYFIKGLNAKIIGALGFFTIYIFYYGGGDTAAFFRSGVMLMKMAAYRLDIYLSIMLGNLDETYLPQFYLAGLCCPDYYRDANTFAVVRYISPLVLLSGFSYLSTTLLLAFVTYLGVWRLFLLFNDVYPGMEKKFAISILYIPSPLFWGSGISKDAITYAATCWFAYTIYIYFIRKQRDFKYLFYLLASAFFIISVKPYIFVALLPGALIWIFSERISRIGNRLVRVTIAPGIILLGLAVTSLITSQLESTLGYYGDIDKALEKAQVSKFDLQRDVYGSNSFDIGEFDGSLRSALTLFPKALVAGLYRPFIFEARNFVNLLSALENTFLLFITLMALLRAGPIRLVKYGLSEPLLMYSLIFSIFFAFSVGLSTSNFGALVRYKIPCIPFFLSALYILQAKIAESRTPAPVFPKVQKETTAGKFYV